MPPCPMRLRISRLGKAAASSWGLGGRNSSPRNRVVGASIAIPSRHRGQEVEPSGSCIPQVGQETDMAELALGRLWNVGSLAARDEESRCVKFVGTRSTFPCGCRSIHAFQSGVTRFRCQIGEVCGKPSWQPLGRPSPVATLVPVRLTESLTTWGGAPFLQSFL